MDVRSSIKKRSALIGVVALGYVGLPLIRSFWDAGFSVLGFDIDPRKIEQLRRGENYLKHLGDDLVSQMLTTTSDTGGDRFDATDDFSRLSEPDVILICVPTPLGAHHEPDLSYVENAVDAIAATLRPGQLIVLESTTYPGTTRDTVLPRLEATGLKHDENFFLAFSPEREDPGRAGQSPHTIPKLVGGISPEAGEVAMLLYRQAIQQVVLVSSAEVAESAKILENVYRAVNIALVNELKVILTAMDIDVWEVVEAAATKPFGFQPFYPGPGLGGHCIPIDPFYLTWKAAEIGQPTRFIELAGQINTQMPGFVVDRLIHALNNRGKAMRGASVLVLGLAYKPNVDDVRESPSFELIRRLRELGAEVDYNDPHVAATHPMRHYPEIEMTSVSIDPPRKLGEYDAVLIATHHDAYNWQTIADHATLVIDTRGAMRHVTGPRDHIVSA